MAALKSAFLVSLVAVPATALLATVAVIMFRGPAEPPALEGPTAPPPGAESKPAPPAEPKAEAGSSRLGVVAGRFDAVNRLLADMGDGYRHTLIDFKDFDRPDLPRTLPVVFLGSADSDHLAAAPKGFPRKVREYVAGGGTLYASDALFDILARAFPDLVDNRSVAQGLGQEVEAEVVDPGLRQVLGRSVPLRFAEDGWRPAAFRGDPVAVLLRGKFRTNAGVEIEAPLAVKFGHGRGSVVFTSFHRRAKNTPAELGLLRGLVLETIVRRRECQAVDELAGRSLSPRLAVPLGLNPEDKPLTFTVDHARAGPLAFRLGLEGADAKALLEVVGPDGRGTTQSGDAVAAIDLPDAAPGAWKVIVTPVKTSFPDFPAVLVAAETAAEPAASASQANPASRASGGNVRFEEVLQGNTARTESKLPRIAVSTPNFDDMGKLLRDLGDGFSFKTVDLDDLLKPGALDGFDIYFLTCGAWPAEWALSTGGPAARQGIVRGSIDRAKLRQGCDTLRRFVERGGVLYASDLRADVIDETFSDRKARTFLNEGALPRVMEAERAWLKLRARGAKVGTTLETLSGAEFTPELKARIERLVAAVESSGMVQGELTRPGANPEAIARKLLRNHRFSFGGGDVQTLARVMTDWEREIAENINRKITNAKILAQIEKATNSLAYERKSLVIDGGGRGRQEVQAQVMDAGLREALGNQEILPLNFRDNAWEPADFLGDNIQVFLRGAYRSTGGAMAEAPLLVRFPEGQGTVIFTSFHNEAQNNEQEKALLRYLVFSAVTAQEETRTDKTMLAGGFTPVKRSQVGHSAGNPEITRTYTSTDDGPIRFGLIFNGGGARLRLTLISPDGQPFKREVKNSLVVEATGAPAGEWTYKVEALEVPYANFPYSVNVGKGSGPAAR